MVGRRTSEVLLEYKTDRSSLADTERAAAAVKDAQLDIAKANEAVAASSDDVAAAAARLTKAQNDQLATARALASGMDKFRKGQELTAKEAALVAKQLNAEADAAENLTKRLGGASGAGGDTLGRGDTLVSALGTLGGTFDFAGAEALGAAGDILGAIDAIQAFKAATTATEAASGAAAAGSLGVAGGFGAVAAAAAPLVLVVAAVAVPLLALKKVLDTASAAAERARESVRRQVEAMRLQAQGAEESRNLTVAEINARREALDREIAANQVAIAGLEARRAEVENSADVWDDLATAIPLLTGTVQGEIGEIDKQIDELTNSVISLAQERMALQDAFARGREDTEQYVSSLERQAFASQRVADIVANNTVASLNEQIAANEADQTARQNIITQLNAQLAAEREHIAALEFGSAEYARSEATIIAYNDALRANQGELETLQLTYEDLNAALPLITETGQEAVNAILQASDAERQRAEFLKNISREGLDEAIANAKTEREVLLEQQRALDALVDDWGNVPEAVQTALDETKANLKETTDFLSFLTSETTRAAAAEAELANTREKEADSLEETKKALEKNIEAERKLTQQIQDDLRRAAQAREKLEIDLQRKLEDISRKGAERRAELEAKFGEIDANAQNERAKAVAKYNRDIEKIREEQRKAERRAAFSHAQTLQGALLSRNVDAFIAEQQRYAEEQSNRDDAESARAEALQDEIRAIEERRKEQIEGNHKALQDLQKQIADERAEAQRAAAERLADQQRAEAEQRQARLAAFNQQLADLQNHLDQETQLKRSSNAAILNNAQMINQSIASAASFAQSAPRASVQTPALGRGLPVATGQQFGPTNITNKFNAPFSAGGFTIGTGSSKNFASAFNQMAEAQARQRQQLARNVQMKVR